MSQSIQFVANSVADGRSFPCSGIPGKAINASSRSSHSYKTNSGRVFGPLRCSSRGMFTVCNAVTGGYQRNPEFSRQNRFSRNRNRQNEERDGSDSFEESEVDSKNGPLLSMSAAPRFQATATPGPREREIVELFRKVQAQLRERAAVKEEKKREELPGLGKESETVDSLLKLLRKHTTQQGKRSTNNTSSKDVILDQSKQNGVFGGDKSTIPLDLIDNGKDEVQELEPSSFTRPVSNFRRRSPVPRVKFQPFDPESVRETYIRPSPRGKANEDEEPAIECESKLEIEPGLGFSDDMDELDEMSEDDDAASDDEDDFSEGNEEEDEDDDEEESKVPIMVMDYNAMKLMELRALAKSRGLKGFSKLKKADLIELLGEGSM